MHVGGVDEMMPTSRIFTSAHAGAGVGARLGCSRRCMVSGSAIDSPPPAAAAVLPATSVLPLQAAAGTAAPLAIKALLRLRYSPTHFMLVALQMAIS